LKESLKELAWTAPRGGKHQQNVLVLLLRLGLRMREQNVCGICLGLANGRREQGREREDNDNRKFSMPSQGKVSYGMSVEGIISRGRLWCARRSAPAVRQAVGGHIQGRK
jgi:hypothetical protein